MTDPARIRPAGFVQDALASDARRIWVAELDGWVVGAMRGSRARRRGVEEVIVWPSERSYPFYERAGFSRTPDPLILYLTDEDA